VARIVARKELAALQAADQVSGQSCRLPGRQLGPDGTDQCRADRQVVHGPLDCVLTSFGAGFQSLSEQVLVVVNLDPALAHQSDERVVLPAGPD
jgi:hypothetical protein